MDVKNFLEENFARITSCKISIDISQDDKIIMLPTHNKIKIFNIDEIIVNGIVDREWYSNSKFIKYECESIVYYNWNKEAVLYPYIQWYSHDELVNKRRIEKDLISNFIAYYKDVPFYTKLEKNEQSEYFLNTYCSIELIKKIIKQTCTNKLISRINELLMSDIKKNFIINGKKSLNIILNNVAKKSNNENFECKFLNNDIKLYNYQINDIEWMNNLVENIKKGNNLIKFKYNTGYNLTFKNKNQDFNFLLYNNTLIPNGNSLNQEITEEIFYNGGNLISVMGLGKTIISLCYIFNNNYNNPFDNYIEFTNTNKCNYFYKRGKNKGTVCVKNQKNGLYCTEHSTTLFIDKRTSNFKNLQNFNVRDYIKDNKFITNASLIICPNHLCDQWVREYYTKFKQDTTNAKRVLLIATYDQYSNLTLGEILFADIIVVSYNFLLNTNYSKLTNTNSDVNINSVLNKLDVIPEQKNNEVNIDFNELILNMQKNILSKHHSNLCILQNFKYSQIFFDESHEIMDRPKKLDDVINSFSGVYYWNITGTPFPNGIESLIFGIKKITSFPKYGSTNQNLFNSNNIKNLSVLYRRNTKESIKTEYTENEVYETVKLLDFTEQERTIYDGYLKGHSKHNNNYDFLIKLCCDTSIDKETQDLVKNCKTLDEIQNVMLNHNKKLVDQSNKKILKLNNLITELNQTLLNNNLTDDQKSELRQQLGNNKRNLTNEKKTFESVSRTYNFLKNAIDTIKITETCPICLDDIIDIAITKCGHKFCQECIHEYVEELKHRNPKCPKCNIEIKIEDIYLLKDTIEQPLILSETSELDKLVIKLKSTKIANIIYYLKNNLNKGDKCILFSQWDPMLNKIGKLLQEEKINVKFCTGTVYERTRAIKDFTNDPTCNVIFLSSENAASGINLTAANKVIFIEPVHGEYQYRKDIENQAAGRVLRINQKRKVEIIRFIIKGTIEQEIIDENERYESKLNLLEENEDNILVV
jgi:SNF2 family DNA or RNA helicase